ncbi:MAG TPA: hypothetical protein VI893_03150 [Thermoplasmata archaeon]|nr:hypothetical protein [Thermoplasmata archaeon]
MTEPGLCADCIHAKRTGNTRGSVFWMCLRSLNDRSYAKYPRLPVTSCAGHEPGQQG